LDKDNSDNLNLINIIPNSDMHDKHKFEMDHILVKKAEIVNDAIFKLPEKYKRVMVMREIENRSYLEISELCVKEYPMQIEKNKIDMPDPVDFLDLKIENNGTDYCYVDFEYNKNKKLQIKVSPNQVFNFNKDDIYRINDKKLTDKSSKNLSKIDVYYIITLLNSDDGISFNDMTKLLLNNDLKKYVINYSANVRRSSLPECASYPSDIKKFFFNEKVSKYTPLKKYLDDNKDSVIENINTLLNDELSDELRIQLTNLLNNLNEIDVIDVNIDEDEKQDSIFDSIRIDTSSKVNCLYRTKTNLSTIKSQISKGRQLIQSMVKKKFKELEDNGLE